MPHRPIARLPFVLNEAPRQAACLLHAYMEAVPVGEARDGTLALALRAVTDFPCPANRVREAP